MSAAIDRPRNSTWRATGFRRSPAQSGQVVAARARPLIARATRDSSPLCSASNSASCRPVPKQLLHQPCRELKENSRGSSSGKPVPQFGQARLVENTAARIARGAVALATCTTPRPCSSAVSSASRSSASPRGIHLQRGHRQFDVVFDEAIEPRPFRRGQQ